jgi:Fe-S-cluster containining protein
MQGVNDEILCRIDLLKSLQESFICKRCGDCCTKQESIAFTERDIKNVSNKKNLSPQEFIERYGLGLVSNPGNLEFYRLPTRTIGGCPFYSDKACSIYDSRPQVCRGFPFLTPENVQNAFEMNGVIVLGGVCNAAIDQVERVLKNSGKQPDVVTRKPRSGTYIILL